MKILELRTLNGPNVFHGKPVLVMTLDLEDLAECASSEIPGFTDRLVAALPGLWEHRCSPGHRGGFVERLRRGTYLGHIIEHVALELSTPVGIEVGFGKTVNAGREGLYNVVVRFKNEEGMRYLLRSAVELVAKVIASEPVQLEPILAEAKRIVEETSLGPSSLAIVEAAERRGIPWRRLGEGSLLQLGYGCRRRRVQTAVSDQTGLIATEIAQDKNLTKRLLEEASVPVPRGFVAYKQDELINGVRDLRRSSFVVKPIDGHHGEGVTLGLVDEGAILIAAEVAWKYSAGVLVEEYCPGRDYRILVVGGRFLAAAERTPASVVGDGRATVGELIAQANLDPRRGVGHGNVLTRIEVDQRTLDYLSARRMTLESVPAVGERVALCQTANLSTGGTARDVTDEAHETVRALCERAARVIGLDICGLDLIHSDISQPVDASTRVIEVNAGPGLRMHVAPSEGKPRDVGSAILDLLYPPGTPARIPIVSITGTNGKTTVARLTARIMALVGCTGLTTSDGIFIGSRLVESGDTTGPRSARLVLADPNVEIAVLETARGGLMRNGLGFDWSDVGVITNIRPDHIGQDGIEDIDDLIRVKSIVAERVRDGGTIVLNADDREASRVMETARLRRSGREIVYYSLDANHPLIRGSDTRAFAVHEGWICEFEGSSMKRIVPVAKLQFALGGGAKFNVSNALAAAAASRSLGATREQVATALEAFESHLHNSGRTNLYKIGQGYVVLDYGHNPDAIAAVSEMARGWNPVRTTVVIGLPGDRADHLLREATRAAARGFDRLILRDDEDLRGREPGEVPDLMRRVLLSEFPHRSHDVYLDQKVAIEAALSSLAKDEVVVILYEDFEAAFTVLRGFDPQPVHEVKIAPAKLKARLSALAPAPPLYNPVSNLEPRA